LLSIKPKHAPKKAIDYLSIEELKRIFSMPKINTVQGKRDLAILTLLYDSGARVQELIDLKYRDLRLDNPATIKLTGKGNKARIVPLMPDTAKILNVYTCSAMNFNHDQQLFLNRSNSKLSRSGIEYIIKKYVKQASEVNSRLLGKKVTPHIFRHSKAMHLVQANVNIIYIRDILGHVSVQTTEVYAKADSRAKRKALEEASKNIVPNTKFTKEKENELLDWLDSIK
jgi:site-specific recombinase XerD